MRTLKDKSDKALKQSKPVFCQSCGMRFGDNKDKFCRHCGKELDSLLVQKSFCPCGAAVIPGDKYCYGCGKEK